MNKHAQEEKPCTIHAGVHCCCYHGILVHVCNPIVLNQCQSLIDKHAQEENHARFTLVCTAAATMCRCLYTRSCLLCLCAPKVTETWAGYYQSWAIDAKLHDSSSSSSIFVCLHAVWMRSFLWCVSDIVYRPGLFFSWFELKHISRVQATTSRGKLGWVSSALSNGSLFLFFFPNYQNPSSQINTAAVETGNLKKHAVVRN